MIKTGSLYYNGVNYGIRYCQGAWGVVQGDDILAENLETIKEVKTFCKTDSKSPRYDGLRNEYMLNNPDVEKSFNRNNCPWGLSD